MKKVDNKNLTESSFQLILHTKIAELLLDGDWRFGRMGLTQFASLMTTLWKAAKEDDPYAELFLLKTHEAIQITKEKLKTYETQLQQQMTELRGIELNLFSITTPNKYPLYFATPFSYMAAMLIEQVDYVNRQLLTLARIGLVPKDQLSVRDLMREIKTLFQLPMQWKYTGVSRKDMLENNQKAKQAIALLGEIPAAVLNQEIEFAFLPKAKGKADAK